MESKSDEPKVFHILNGQAAKVEPTPYGSVGTVFSGQGIEAVWVSKQDEAIDPGWFSQPVVDLLVVIQGQLKVEFANPDLKGFIMQPGDLLILPAQTQCRAYRWPREAKQPTIFFAAYPQSVVKDTGHIGENNIKELCQRQIEAMDWQNEPQPKLYIRRHECYPYLRAI